MADNKLTPEMDSAAFDRLATRMLRQMFLAGFCFGAAMAGLLGIGATTAFSVLFAGVVVWIAWRGWPWEV